MRRILRATAVLVALLAVIAVIGVGWYYSSEILTVEAPSPPERDVEVLAVEDDTVTLESTEASRREGTWGLDAPQAYAQVHEILEADADSVTRELDVLHGTLQQGDVVAVDGYAYPEDPDAAFDFEVRELAIPAPLGRQTAWWLEGDSDRWAILVHGRAGARHECFRLLPLLRDRDVNAVCISYRNDPGGPTDPQGFYRQGATEWEDVEAAVRLAVDRGADDVLLVGYSMGGQITANFLRRSELADVVDAVIWDAPLLDWGPALQVAADDRGVPRVVVPLGMQASELRAGVDYEQLDHVANADEFDVPILLFHGTGDTTVPVSVSDRFAEARPDLVTYERVDDAGHVRSWNHRPERYERAVTRFLDEHGFGS